MTNKKVYVFIPVNNCSVYLDHHVAKQNPLGKSFSAEVDFYKYLIASSGFLIGYLHFWTFPFQIPSNQSIWKFKFRKRMVALNLYIFFLHHWIVDWRGWVMSIAHNIPYGILVLGWIVGVQEQVLVIPDTTIHHRISGAISVWHKEASKLIRLNTSKGLNSGQNLTS